MKQIELRDNAISDERSPDLRRRSLIASAVGLSLSGVLFAPAARANDLVVGKAAPPVTLHTLDGKDIATTDLIGKVVIVTFWATYCDPCREELPLLSDYAKAHAKHGLQVLGFCIDPPDNIDEVKKVAESLSFPVGLTGTPYVGGYGRIWRMPVSFVIDRAGRLVDDGWKDDNPVWTKERLHRVMDPLLLGVNK
jgi:thiol-disulfide isomerase/thioredoxin